MSGVSPHPEFPAITLYAARSLCRLKSPVVLSGKKFLSTKFDRGARRVKRRHKSLSLNRERFGHASTEEASGCSRGVVPEKTVRKTIAEHSMCIGCWLNECKLGHASTEEASVFLGSCQKKKQKTV